mmetsp:Transcript_30870/g.64431  ORF Transcript_30870/g.64431 Transcript_30870/m.64431 type:complete len:399 (-) Transcript_30870:404-1600(-)
MVTPTETTTTSTKSDTTAKSSTMATSAADTAASSCDTCQKLLRQVFEQSGSRPRSLLASMMPFQNDNNNNKTASSSSSVNNNGFQWRTTPTGIQVKIPTEESLPQIPLAQRRWSRIQPPKPASESDELRSKSSFSGPTAPLFQATSSSSLPSSLQHPPLKSGADATTPGEEATGSATTAMTQSKDATRNDKTKTTEWMNVSCEICPWTGPKGNARAFVNGPQPLDIVICSNRLRHAHRSPKLARQEMEEILTHEMIHVYDARQLQLDLRVCENLAYSEVRAAREAECRVLAQKYQDAAQANATTSSSSYWPLTAPSPSSLLTSCVKERAFLATKNMFSYSNSRACLNRVFDTAMADQRPFDTQHAPPQSVPTTATPIATSASPAQEASSVPDPFVSQR